MGDNSFLVMESEELIDSRYISQKREKDDKMDVWLFIKNYVITRAQ